VLALAAFSAGHAEAELQAIGETSIGYTDNLRTTPDMPLSDGEPRSTGAYLMLSPGAVLALASPRHVQRLGYRYEYDFYFGESDSSSSSSRLDYRGFFDVSQRVSLVLGANATASDRFSTVSFAAPGAGAVGALPSGSGSFLQAGADQAFSLDVAPGWRAWQGASVVGDTPMGETDGPRTAGAGARVGLERAFLFDAVGVEGRGDYSVIWDGVRSDGARVELSRQLVAAGVVLWRHDWGRYFTTRAEVGVLRVERLETSRHLWAPTGAAAIAYATEQGDAQLSYSHTAVTNSLIGQSLLVDDVRLRGAIPLTPQAELGLAVTSGFQHGRLIDEDATLAARVNVLLLDVALAWQANKSLEVGLRYQHVRQDSDALTPPLPLSFIQNSVLLGAVLKFPSEGNLPQPYRAPRRVDGSDEIRDGIRSPNEGPRAPGELSR